jgi:hypothetical protein
MRHLALAVGGRAGLAAAVTLPLSCTLLAVEPTDDELDRLGALMYLRALYLVCFGYRRAVSEGAEFREWGFIHPPEYYRATAAAKRAAFRR